MQISDFYTRLFIKRNTITNKFKTVIKNDCFLPKTISFFSKKKKNSTLINNRCILTGRSKAVLKKYRISRMPFKYLALHGYLPGVSKTSW